MIKSKIEDMSTELKELILGVLIFAVIFQIAIVWLFSEKLYFTIGLWVGAVMAIFMAIHMNYSISRMLDLPEGSSGKYMVKMTAIRMSVVLIVFVLLCIWNTSTGIPVILGMLTLKLGAYLQPLLHKWIKKRKKGG